MKYGSDLTSTRNTGPLFCQHRYHENITKNHTRNELPPKPHLIREPRVQPHGTDQKGKRQVLPMVTERKTTDSGT